MAIDLTLQNDGHYFMAWINLVLIHVSLWLVMYLFLVIAGWDAWRLSLKAWLC